MINNSILDVAIGLVFCYASLGLLTSSIVEFIAAMLKWRHKELLVGIRELLNNTDYVGALYRHALINPLLMNGPKPADAEPVPPGTPIPAPGAVPVGDPHVDAQAQIPVKLPAYIPSDQFAQALTDLIAKIPGDIISLKEEIEKIKDPQLKALFSGFVGRSGDSIKAFEDQVARWFDNGMDRLAGAYKRTTQRWTFLIALAIAIIFNIDSVHLLKELWRRPALTAAITSPSGLALMEKTVALQEKKASHVTGNLADAGGSGFATSDAAPGGGSSTTAKVPPVTDNPNFQDPLTLLSTLPIGWSDGSIAEIWHPKPREKQGGKELFWENAGRLVTFLLGLLITASAALFGAPFWFDLLQRLIQVRGTGTKPLTGRERTMLDVKPTRAR